MLLSSDTILSVLVCSLLLWCDYWLAGRCMKPSKEKELANDKICMRSIAVSYNQEIRLLNKTLEAQAKGQAEEGQSQAHSLPCKNLAPRQQLRAMRYGMRQSSFHARGGRGVIVLC